MDEVALRSLVPQVLAILVRRGADFAAGEDAVQDALVEAVRVWPDDPPRDPKGWLISVAWRRYLEPQPGSASDVDDTLALYFLCAHPSLTPSSAAALTLRAVGGLPTRQITEAYLVPEAGTRWRPTSTSATAIRYRRHGCTPRRRRRPPTRPNAIT